MKNSKCEESEINLCQVQWKFLKSNTLPKVAKILFSFSLCPTQAKFFSQISHIFCFNSAVRLTQFAIHSNTTINNTYPLAIQSKILIKYLPAIYPYTLHALHLHINTYTHTSPYTYIYITHITLHTLRRLSAFPLTEVYQSLHCLFPKCRRGKGV